MLAGTWFVVNGDAHHRRLRRLPAPGRRLLPPDRQDRRGDRDLSEGHCRLPALHRASRRPSPTSPTGPAPSTPGAARRTSASTASASATPASRPVLCAASTSTSRAGETVAFVGPSGAGKTTICSAAAALLRRRRRARSPIDGDRHPRHDARLAARPDRHRAAGRLPVRRHDPREHRLRPARRHRGRDRRGGPTRAARRR